MLHSWKSIHEYVCAILMVMLVAGQLPANAATPIATYDDLVANTSPGAGNERVLNTGAYEITPGSSINFGSNVLVLNNSASTLQAAQDATNGALLTVQGLNVSEGALTAVGGGSSSSNGVYISNGMAQSGGIVTATGGSRSGTAGIWIQAGGYQLTDGIVNLFGGTATNTSGMRLVGGAFDMYGGTLTTTGSNEGGTVNQGYGMYVTGTGAFTLHNGTINAEGGDGTQNHGLYVQRNFLMENGTLNGTGGPGNNARGILVYGTFTQQQGDVDLLGGGSFYANGMEVFSSTYTMNGGTLTATGGSVDSAFGLRASSFVQNNGAVSGLGGTNAGAHGISISGNYTLTNGTVEAKASDNSRGYGISVSGTFTQSGGQVDARGQGNSDPQYASIGLYAGNYTMQAGSLTGVGGTGERSRGLYVANTFTLTDGDITATAGTADITYGVQAGTFNQNGGTIQASGAGTDVNDSTSGLFVTTFTQNNGTLTTDGGTGENSRGSTFTTLRQNNGIITATGGTGANAYGMYTGTSNQVGGTMIARGGSGDSTGYGVFAAGTMTVGDELRLERQASAASVYLGTGGQLNLLAGSTLVPVVDMAKFNGPNFRDASGLIASASGNINIGSGAKVRPFFTDTRTITLRRQIVDIPFIDLGTGTITGDFVDTGVHRGLFLDYVVQKDGDNRYVLSIERTGEIGSEILDAPCKNSKEIVRLIDGILTRNPTIAPLNAVWDTLDNSADWDEFTAYFAHIGRTLMPQAYLKFTHTLNRMTDLTQTDFKRQIAAIAAFEPLQVYGSEAYSTLAFPSGWTTWANPLYQQSSKNGTTCNEFEKGKEKFFGMATGIAKDTGTLTVGGALNYVRGRYTAPFSSLDADSFGIIVGGRVRDIAHVNDWINPWLDFSFGYTYASIDQKNMGFDYIWRDSSPSASMLRAAVDFGNSFAVTNRFSIATSLGIDYTRIHQSGYTDRGDSLYRLRIGGGTTNSVRPSAGVDFRFEVTPLLALTARSTFRYELGDRRSSFDTQAISFPELHLTTRGEDRNRYSSTVGGGLDYRFNDQVSVNLRYDLLLEHKYRAHRLEAGIAYNF